MSTEIKAGDIVVLKSGGPTMTVGRMIAAGEEIQHTMDERQATRPKPPETDLVECHWFQDNSQCHVSVSPRDGDVPDPIHWGDPRFMTFPADTLLRVGEGGRKPGKWIMVEGTPLFQPD